MYKRVSRYVQESEQVCSREQAGMFRRVSARTESKQICPGEHA